MHPLFRSPRNLLAALALWLPIGVGLAVLTARNSGVAPQQAALLVVPAMLPQLFLSLSSWFLCRLQPVQVSRLPRIFILHSLAAAVTAFLWVVVLHPYALLLDHLNGVEVWLPLLAANRGLLFGAAMALYIVAGLFHYLVLALERSFRAEQQALEDRLAASQAELKALKATVHPHFLFNSLNALASLIVLDPPRARRACLNLADFLRYSVRYQQMGPVTLRHELEHLDNYLDIERLRLDERLQVEKEVEPGLEEFPILPLLVLPLVENALKHGIQQHLHGGLVRIAVQRAGGGIRIVIANPAPPPDAPPPKGEGLGLKTLRRRLFVHYGTEARLEMQRTQERVEVTLALPGPPLRKETEKP